MCVTTHIIILLLLLLLLYYMNHVQMYLFNSCKLFIFSTVKDLIIICIFTFARYPNECNIFMAVYYTVMYT